MSTCVWQSKLSLCRHSSSRSGDTDLLSSRHTPSVTLLDDDVADSDVAKSALNNREAVYFAKDELFDKYPARHVAPAREVWVESLTQDSFNQDLLRLHPDIFSVKPRLDILWSNIDWQIRYRSVKHDKQLDRFEMHYGGRPWPQKGMGKARHRSRTSPLWFQGGKINPNRGINGSFFMLPMGLRIRGLVHALSAKLGQDDLKIVQDLNIPSKDPEYINKLIDDRWYN